jgi:hypothetical protein
VLLAAYLVRRRRFHDAATALAWLHMVRPDVLAPEGLRSEVEVLVAASASRQQFRATW